MENIARCVFKCGSGGQSLWISHLEPPSLQGMGYWGRAASTFQWLPRVHDAIQVPYRVCGAIHDWTLVCTVSSSLSHCTQLFELKAPKRKSSWSFPPPPPSPPLPSTLFSVQRTDNPLCYIPVEYLENIYSLLSPQSSCWHIRSLSL